MWVKKFFITILLILDAVYVFSQAEQYPGHYERLLKDLFKDYDKRVRPYAYENVPVTISETLLGSILIQIDSNQQIASFVVTKKQNWTDPRFKWDPIKYGGIKSILVPVGDVWRSDIFNYNLKDFENLLADYKDWARIMHDGTINFNIPQYAEATCKIMVHRFPFDTQYCTLSLSSNLMDDTQLVFKPIPVSFSASNFFGNSEWGVENVSLNVQIVSVDGVWGEKGYVFKYVFELKRCPTFYLMVIVIPTFLLTAVSIVGIFAPGGEHEPGDVANLGLGTLLALMVLLGIVSDKLPKSQEMPLLGFYILVILVVFVLCILLEIASLYYFRQCTERGSTPPEWLYTATGFNLFGKHKKNKNSHGVVDIFERVKRTKNELQRRISEESETSSGSGPNSKSTNTLTSLVSGSSGFKIDIDEDRGQKSGSDSGSGKKGKKGGTLIKRVLSNKTIDKKQMGVWRSVIGELKEKQDERRKEIKHEWDTIENRLDFIWIAIFEVFNVLNVLVLLYVANLEKPPMDEWLNG